MHSKHFVEILPSVLKVIDLSLRLGLLGSPLRREVRVVHGVRHLYFSKQKKLPHASISLDDAGVIHKEEMLLFFQFSKRQRLQ